MHWHLVGSAPSGMNGRCAKMVHGQVCCRHLIHSYYLLKLETGLTVPTPAPPKPPACQPGTDRARKVACQATNTPLSASHQGTKLVAG